MNREACTQQDRIAVDGPYGGELPPRPKERQRDPLAGCQAGGGPGCTARRACERGDPAMRLQARAATRLPEPYCV